MSYISSGATFGKGSLVNYDAGFLVREYLSTDSNWLGIALSNSTASLPGPFSSLAYSSNSGAVLVAIPRPGCTFYSDLTTGVTQSALSIGKTVLIYKQGNLMSYASTVAGATAAESVFSGTVTIVGPIDSTNSRVEVAANMRGVIFYTSASTTTNLS